MSRFAMVRNKDMEHAKHMLRAGQTRGQLNQAMLDKAVGALATGALTVGGGAIQAGQAENKQQEAKEGAERLRKQQEAKEGAERLRLQGPAWLRGGKLPGPVGFPEEQHQDQGPTDLSLATDQASRNQDTNMAAAVASIGGFRTPKGLDDTENESDMRAADINTSKSMMKMGGMMNSLTRTR